MLLRCRCGRNSAESPIQFRPQSTGLNSTHKQERRHVFERLVVDDEGHRVLVHVDAHGHLHDWLHRVRRDIVAAWSLFPLTQINSQLSLDRHVASVRGGWRNLTTVPATRTCDVVGDGIARFSDWGRSPQQRGRYFQRRRSLPSVGHPPTRLCRYFQRPRSLSSCVHVTQRRRGCLQRRVALVLGPPERARMPRPSANKVILTLEWFLPATTPLLSAAVAARTSPDANHGHTFAPAGPGPGLEVVWAEHFRTGKSALATEVRANARHDQDQLLAHYCEHGSLAKGTSVSTDVGLTKGPHQGRGRHFHKDWVNDRRAVVVRTAC
jgi:hypothetical protein